eukprot:15220428-Alexandrium_andersonii.AAC.1
MTARRELSAVCVRGLCDPAVEGNRLPVAAAAACAELLQHDCARACRHAHRQARRCSSADAHGRG